jgi:hypothetical protein
MRKLLTVLLLVIPLAGSARMFPTEFPVKAVCWDSVKEAVDYHQEMLGEYPVGKGWISDKSFAAIMFNPVKPSWTFLSFHTSESGVIICAITGGTQWDILSPGDEAEKLEL